MIDIAQLLQNAAVMLPNDAYASAAAVNAADVEIDTASYCAGRALIAVINEDTTNATAITINESDTSGGAATAVPAAALTNPATGAAATLDTLDNETFQLIAVNLHLTARYLSISAATDPAAASAITVLFLAPSTEV